MYTVKKYNLTPHENFSAGKDLMLLVEVVFFLSKIKVGSLRIYTGGAMLYTRAFLRTRRYAPDFFFCFFFIFVRL